MKFSTAAFNTFVLAASLAHGIKEKQRFIRRARPAQDGTSSWDMEQSATRDLQGDTMMNVLDKEDQEPTTTPTTTPVTCPCFTLSDIDIDVEALRDPICDLQDPGIVSFRGFRSGEEEGRWFAGAGADLAGEDMFGCRHYDTDYGFPEDTAIVGLSQEEVEACQDILMQSQMFAENKCQFMAPTDPTSPPTVEPTFPPTVAPTTTAAPTPVTCPCFTHSDIDINVKVLVNSYCPPHAGVTALIGERPTEPRRAWRAVVRENPPNDAAPFCRHIDPLYGFQVTVHGLSQEEIVACTAILKESQMFMDNHCNQD